MNQRNQHLKRNIRIVVFAILLLLLVVVTGFSIGLFDRHSNLTSTSTLLSNSTSKIEPVLQGNNLTVGDTFTYKLSGSSVLGDTNAATPAYLSQYNNTDFYEVTITGINGTHVSLNALWRFINGTQVESSQIIDLSDGIVSDPNGFWAIYTSDLSLNDLLHPKGSDKLIVNSTDTQTFATSIRTRNFWSTANQFVDPNDPTGNTMREDYLGVYFDKQTGMLESLTNIQFFTNPEIEITITWQLSSSNVWAVQ
jgi:hypothetical protein